MIKGIRHAQSSAECLQPRFVNPQFIDPSMPRAWLQRCVRDHSIVCSPKIGASVAGFRVLDCKSRKIVEGIQSCPYVALSYVWGPPQTGLLQDSLFPRTIEDAITITRIMGFDYLWIDRYCIDQNDPEQKHAQIGKMDEIFAGASLVIIAAAGSDPHHGLPGIKYIFFSWTSTDFIPATVRTMQEGYLSKRRLIFMDHQIAYACCDDWCAESFTSAPNYADSDMGIRLSRIFQTAETDTSSYLDPAQKYNRLVREYTKRDLTYSGDALNAFLGILNSCPPLGLPKCPANNQSRNIQHSWGVYNYEHDLSLN
ncbi:HET-domain-containing protein [Ophiobolus disseminans]|uniref:HET-domain-containing protein n=1 Tax=Ophiobolus disseminans TaxID=1469910 RepID=A0A6A6ZT84_9PLEO|nr:HET-domain-containing protein [Ophiobolus disseminans]